MGGSDKMELNKNEKALLSILVLFLAIYLFYILLYKPLLVSINSMKQENEDLQTLLVMTKKEVEKNTDQEFDAKVSEFINLNKKLPEQPYIPETIQFIEDIGRANKLNIIHIEYDENKSKQSDGDKIGHCELVFELAFIGSYRNLVNLVTDIEKESRIYQIKQISLLSNNNPKSDISDDMSYSKEDIVMNIVFKSFYNDIRWHNIKGVPELTCQNQPSFNPFKKE